MPTSWCPALITVEMCGNDYAFHERAIYAKFKQDLITSTPVFRLKPVTIQRNPIVDDREFRYWHCITVGKVENDRTPCLRRCERIAWIKAFIEEYPSERVVCWTNERKKKGKSAPEKRILLAPIDFSYVVVFNDLGDRAALLTAYPVESDKQRERLKNEYEESRNRSGAAVETAPVLLPQPGG